MSKNITVRDLLKNVNEVLAVNFTKEVIKTGYDKYDTENGRDVISLWDLQRIIQDESGANFSAERNDLVMWGNALTIKTKRKKSGILNNWKHTDQLTVTEIYTENEMVLDKTFEELNTEREQAQKDDEQEDKERTERRKQKIVKTLKDHNMTLDQFEQLIFSYEKLGYRDKESLKELMEN